MSTKFQELLDQVLAEGLSKIDALTPDELDLILERFNNDI